MLITKPPHSGEGAERMCGISSAARLEGMEVSIYLIGDGVLCAKKNQRGHVGANIKLALETNVQVFASSMDLLARGLSGAQVEDGVKMVGNIEDMFVEDVMEHSTRVVSW
ncbi:MAG: DsrE family protein [Candidatus Bathyarchaeota archaeon]|nr:DsrE family protein [Candidatus Bathyarchaeota archaeon]